MVADLVIIPTRPSPHDLRAVDSTVALVEACKDYFKALTVELDRERYHRLKQANLNQDKTSQQLFVEALDAYPGRDA
jgi:cellulose biosynthesis protein BcsQ